MVGGGIIGGGFEGERIDVGGGGLIIIALEGGLVIMVGE